MLEPGLEAIFYNSRNEIDQMPFLLAVLRPDDSDAQFRDKARLVANYLDLVFVRRAVNNKMRKSEELYLDTFPLIPELRRAVDLDEISKLLGRRSFETDVDFTGVKQYGLRPDNHSQVRYLLARLTSFVEVESGRPNEIFRYLDMKEPFEVEHVWADKFDRHQPEVKTEAVFRVQRNRLGALLLLRKSHNASYQDAPFEQKVEWYRGQNHLAASLHEATHQRNKPFTDGVVKRYQLGRLFHPVRRFDVNAIKLRQELYERLCEIIWDIKRLGFTPPPNASVPAPPVPVATTRRTRAHYGGVTVARLLEVGVLRVGEELVLTYKGNLYRACINGLGKIELESGEPFDSPSPAAITATGKPTMNGWSVWKVRRDDKAVPLFDVRADALSRGLLEGTA